MRQARTLGLIGAASLALGAVALAQPHQPGHGDSHVMLLPSEMAWGPIPSLPPGASLAVIEGPLNRAGPITARISFPANYRLPPHTHPVIEHVTVISGTFHMGQGEQFDPAKTRPLTAGSFAIMPPGTPHFAWTAEPTVVQIHSVGPWGVTYVNPADDPRGR
jgi:quercetin dioxygenase-like cupin family protein